eukprot:4046595-Amphidinium_carterae.1
MEKQRKASKQAWCRTQTADPGARNSIETSTARITEDPQSLRSPSKSDEGQTSTSGGMYAMSSSSRTSCAGMNTKHSACR